MGNKKVVSVQDISCYGQCSQTIALPILSAYGIETAILPSGILSTHTGCFSRFTFLDLTDEMVKIVDHWKKEQISFDAIYTGYIGDARQFDIIKDMKPLLNKGAKIIVDPAMADRGKLYPALGMDIVDGMKKIICEADIILPNLTEAAFLLGIEYKENYSRKEINNIAVSLANMGAKIVILTGVSYEEGRIGAVAYDATTKMYTEYFVEKQVESYHGTGDIFSSLIIANLLNEKDLEYALKDACDFIVEAIKATLGDDNHPYGVKFEKVLAKRANII